MGLGLRRQSRNRFKVRSGDIRMWALTKEKCEGKNKGSETPLEEVAD